jgi:RNA-binding protein
MSKPRRPAPDLSGKQRRHLRGLGHDLHAVAQIGQNGLSEALVKKVAEELDHHELIKVKIGQGAVESIKETGTALAEQTGSHLTQVIGRTVLLYRMRKHEPDIRLPY